MCKIKLFERKIIFGEKNLVIIFIRLCGGEERLNFKRLK